MARRDDVVVQSCPLCLRADEAPSMVAVEVPQGPGSASWRWLLCRQCARAIADAWDRLAFEESRAEVHSGDNSGDQRSRAASGDVADSAADLVVLGNRPSDSQPGINRGELGTDASGEGTSGEAQSAAAESDLERSENSGK